MKIKKGASLTGLKIEMRKVLILANIIWGSYGQELVITCGTNGVHSPGSIHYYGYALDFRSRYFTIEDISEISKTLQTRLGSEYSVVPEKNHIHVEYRGVLDDL